MSQNLGGISSRTGKRSSKNTQIKLWKKEIYRDIPVPPKPCLTIKEKLVRLVNEKRALSGSNERVPTLVNMPFSCRQLTKKN
jgi:hypothetical protein